MNPAALPDIPLGRLLAFIEEDAPFGDVTSMAVLDEISCTAVIIAREDLILAGLAELRTLCDHFRIAITLQNRDGEAAAAGTIVADLAGPARGVLLIERTVLNIMGRMSGIATRTRRIQDRVAAVNPGCRIAGTRKTAPGLRLMDKKALMIGGADPHRFSLSDAILIKDTHRTLVPLQEAVRRARGAGIYHRIEAEVESVEDALVAAKEGADILLLDNMSVKQAEDTIRALVDAGLREQVLIEISGGIREEEIEAYAALSIDRISMGSLTHSVRNADFSLEITGKP